MLAACSPFGGGGSDTKSMVVRTFPAGKDLGTYKVSENSMFSLTFVHSVSNTPVQDDYMVINDRILQVAETFMTHVAGLPSEVNDPLTQRWEQKEGKFILHMKRPIKKLVVRTDKNYNNRLIVGGRIINLNQWEDQALEILVKP